MIDLFTGIKLGSNGLTTYKFLAIVNLVTKLKSTQARDMTAQRYFNLDSTYILPVVVTIVLATD